MKSKYQVCVPQHRDGDKTTTCITPGGGRVVTIEFDGLFLVGLQNCPEGETDEVAFIGSTEKFNEYTILNVPSTQIWQATWNSGVTFNVTLRLIINEGDNFFIINFLGQCIAEDLLTLPVILTTTVF